MLAVKGKQGLSFPGFPLLAAAVFAAGLGRWSIKLWQRSTLSRRQIDEFEVDFQASQKLLALYDMMEGRLSQKGLNVDGIKQIRPFFSGLGGSPETPAWGGPRPKKYTELEPPAGPLAFPTVRLLVLPLGDAPLLVSRAAAATREVVSVLPAGDMFLNSQAKYHVTLFHTSGLWDPTTDPLDPTGGFASSSAPCERARSTDATLSRERERLEALAACTEAPTVVVDRVIFADSGVLLLLFVEQGRAVEEIRRKARELFPGMPSKQPNIIHTSLMRYLNPHQLTAEQTQAVQTVCRRWTLRLRGMKLSPQSLW